MVLDAPAQGGDRFHVTPVPPFIEPKDPLEGITEPRGIERRRELNRIRPKDVRRTTGEEPLELVPIDGAAGEDRNVPQVDEPACRKLHCEQGFPARDKGTRGLHGGEGLHRATVRRAAEVRVRERCSRPPIEHSVDEEVGGDASEEPTFEPERTTRVPRAIMYEAKPIEVVAEGRYCLCGDYKVEID